MLTIKINDMHNIQALGLNGSGKTRLTGAHNLTTEVAWVEISVNQLVC